MTNCYTCNNSTVCLGYNKNSYLYNGACVQICPANYYPKKIADNDTNTAHCHPCSSNCTNCVH